tara:strand:+ start:9935 stop:10555 length:621 start_codon:yes stop_codon:yes gene_type:complete
MDKQQLIDFEEDIAKVYEEGKIKGPIHLRDGNENQLIDIFKDIKKDDWVFATWANHLEALLKGIPADLVKARILEGESMAMNFPDYKFYTSAIVGGICPIAVGTALALKEKESHHRVFVFIGDMAVVSGIANECIRYSINHNLPITWVVADNNKSVMTDTRKAYGKDIEKYLLELARHTLGTDVRILSYQYTSKWPHSGTGTFVSF